MESLIKEHLVMYYANIVNYIDNLTLMGKNLYKVLL